MIISVHLPKTAGTSFFAALEQRFGERLLKDYDDYPINNSLEARKKAAVKAGFKNAFKSFGAIECIHGHFLPAKYLLLAVRRPVTFVTWLRHPADRVLSHYHFWKKIYDPVTAPDLHRKMVEEGWRVERFCLGPELRDLYSQFLWGFPLTRFDFVGVVEFYDEDLAHFSSRYLGARSEPRRLNAGESPGSGHTVSTTLRDEIESYHARDMGLYRAVLEMRKKRTALS